MVRRSATIILPGENGRGGATVEGEVTRPLDAREYLPPLQLAGSGTSPGGSHVQLTWQVAVRFRHVELQGEGTLEAIYVGVDVVYYERGWSSAGDVPIGVHLTIKVKHERPTAVHVEWDEPDRVRPTFLEEPR